jgi:hypothetical protein
MGKAFQTGLALGIGLAVAALSAVAAQADIIYTITETGTIGSGLSLGAFGARGTNLAGQAFSVTQTFNATLSTDNPNGTQVDYLSPANSGVIVTIGSNSYTILPNSNSTNEYLISNSYYDEIYGRTASSTGNASYVGYVYSYVTNFLASDSLAQNLVYTLPNSVGSYAGFTGADSSYFNGSLTSIALNPAPAAPTGPAVSEPASAALLCTGLIGLGWLRRRNTASAVTFR